MSNNLTLNIDSTGRFSIENNQRIVFLCGVFFDKKDRNEKRKVLQKYLRAKPNLKTVILEEHFPIYKYLEIACENLHDVETLTACYADEVIVVHESLSTAAEIGMMASNSVISSKLYVLYPDKDSLDGEEKISGFIKYAFLGVEQKGSILSKHHLIEYKPGLDKKYFSNNQYKLHTYFPSNLGTKSSFRDKLDEIFDTPTTKQIEELKFNQTSNLRINSPDDTIIDFFEDSGNLNVVISFRALRAILFSLTSCENPRKQIESCKEIFEAVNSLKNNFNNLLISTLSPLLKNKPKEITVWLKGIESSSFVKTAPADTLNKSIGLFLYLLHAIGDLYIGELNPNSKKRKREFSFNKSSASTRKSYDGVVKVLKPSEFNSTSDIETG